MPSKIKGIDLGSTYSCIAMISDAGEAVLIPNFENEDLTPSVVQFTGPKKFSVGRTPKRQAELYPDATAELFKRDMGNPNFLFEFDGETWRPEELSSLVLKKIVEDAEKQTGEKIEDVVITCPAWFGIAEREATKQAGILAGLNVCDVISEPTAAAIAYGLTRGEPGDEDNAQNNDAEVVLVYDLGGGTFDITMIEINRDEIKVICTGGEHTLGGKDWDMAIVNYLVQEFQEATGCDEDPLDDEDTRQELITRAEVLKQDLSITETARIRVAHAGERHTVELTRETFNQITQDKLNRTIELTREMLQEAEKKGYTDFSRILMVGGSTRMPQIEERLRAEFRVDCIHHDPDEAVAKGAALYGLQLQHRPRTDSDDKGSESENEDGPIFVPGLPGQKTVINVTSKSFGVMVIDENGEEVVALLIKRNDSIPVQTSSKFRTIEDNQEIAEIRLMESTDLDDIIPLTHAEEVASGELKLPPGLPINTPIEVVFALGENGLLSVSASEHSTGSNVEFEADMKGVMSAGEVEKSKARNLGMERQN